MSKFLIGWVLSEDNFWDLIGLQNGKTTILAALSDGTPNLDSLKKEFEQTVLDSGWQRIPPHLKPLL